MGSVSPERLPNASFWPEAARISSSSQPENMTANECTAEKIGIINHIFRRTVMYGALLIPCIAGRSDTPETSNILTQTALLGSVIPAAWNFMLAARARGLGTAWSTLHLMQEKEVADIIGIPYDDYMQVALIPIAYTKGTKFKRAYRPPVETVMHFNEW
jgi:nitroreductase